MEYDYAQRRRVALALAITVIAVPSAFLLNRGGGDDDAIAGTQPNQTVAARPNPDTGPTATDALGEVSVGFLTGSTLPLDQSPARIAIPQMPDAITGTATFSSTITSTTRCLAKGVPYAATLQITNLDNSQSVRCVASLGGDEPTEDVVLAPETFAKIADLTDAPVPVQITWTAK